MRKNNPSKKKVFTGLVVNVLLVSMLIFMMMGVSDHEYITVSGSPEPYQILNPEEWENDLDINNNESAWYWANDQLDDMGLGNIISISEIYTATLILDHSLGNVIYWLLESNELEIKMDANTSEIIQYERYEGQAVADPTAPEGTMFLQAVEQFHVLPNDAGSPDVYTSTLFGHNNVDYYSETVPSTDEDNQTSTNVWCSWVCAWNRTEDSIVTDDKIIVMFSQMTILFYYKAWFMDLNDIDTYYDITQTQAESAVSSHWSGCSINETTKRIGMPNNFWEYQVSENEFLTYGTTPISMWLVIADNSTDQRIYYVLGIGQEPVIVGGDWIVGLYIDPENYP